MALKAAQKGAGGGLGGGKGGGIGDIFKMSKSPAKKINKVQIFCSVHVEFKYSYLLHHYIILKFLSFLLIS